MLRIVQLLRSLLLILITVAAQGIQFLRWALSSRGCLECRGTVPAQAAGVLPGTPNSTSQAHRRGALFFGVVVPVLQLERVINDCQTRDPRRLASPGIQAVVAVQVAVGTTPDFGRLRRLIVRMVRENPTWGEERVAAELSVKLGILVSPRTVRAYWPHDADPKDRRRTSSQHWRSFVRNHAQAMVAADFLVAITAGFQVLYVLVVMEIGSRRILHCNVTAHPTAAWTLQQFREAVDSDHSHRFLIHDRDSTFSTEVDAELQAFGLKVLRTPVQAPKANAYCERLMGTLRRECLNYVIPLSEKHLRTILREWVAHYNQGRPHSSLGQAFQISK